MRGSSASETRPPASSAAPPSAAVRPSSRRARGRTPSVGGGQSADDERADHRIERPDGDHEQHGEEERSHERAEDEPESGVSRERVRSRRVSRGSGGRLRTRSSAIAASATRASGTCTTKIARQSKSCVSTPPSAGPAAAPIVPAIVQTAAPRAGEPANAARPRSDAASNSAPPSPCRQRKPMRTSRLQAAAQPAEPAAKRPMPTIPVGRGRRRRAKGTRQRAATATTRLYERDHPGDADERRVELAVEVRQREHHDR